MKRIVASVGLIALTAAGAANAGEASSAGQYPSKEESVGMVGGMAIGAAAGGPFGAIIGLALGGWIGDRMDTQNQTVVSLEERLQESDATLTALSTQLSESQGSVASLTAQLADSERRIALLQAPEGGSIAPALQRSLRGEIMFRTNDSTVGADTTDRLIELAQVLAVAPEAVVQIDGYADPRGTKEENLVLSEQRAEAVRAALIAGGLEADRILVRPHGEHATVSARGDVDGYALERRVVITIGAKQPAVAEVTD